MTSPAEPTVLVLRGTQCIVPGEVCTRGQGPVGIAMSRGRLPKAHPSLDPNEDAAAVVAGLHGVVAAVCDGHRGADAALAVLDAVVAWAQPLVRRPVGDPTAALRQAFEQARLLVAERLATVAAPRRGSRTAVTVAVVAGRRCTVATVGDTAAFLQRRGRLLRFRGTGTFLGTEPLAPLVTGRRLRPADRLLLATDGLEDFTGPRTIRNALRSTAGAPAVDGARALVQTALLGGAGDNVTAVTVDQLR